MWSYHITSKQVHAVYFILIIYHDHSYCYTLLQEVQLMQSMIIAEFVKILACYKTGCIVGLCMLLKLYNILLSN